MALVSTIIILSSSLILSIRSLFFSILILSISLNSSKRNFFHFDMKTHFFLCTRFFKKFHFLFQIFRDFFVSIFLFQLGFSAFLPIGLWKSKVSSSKTSSLPAWSWSIESEVWGNSFLKFSLGLLSVHFGRFFNKSQQCSNWKLHLYISLNKSLVSI